MKTIDRFDAAYKFYGAKNRLAFDGAVAKSIVWELNI